MRHRKSLALLTAWLGGALLAGPANAAQHNWFISQVYTDATGTVQFIEFVGRNDFQNFFANGGHRIDIDSGATIPLNMDLASTQTQGAHFLVASRGFTELPGAIQPDFIAENGFLDPNGDGIDFLPNRSGGDVVMGLIFPLDGRSVSRQGTPGMDTSFANGMDAGPLLGSDGLPVPNIARNFAGESFVVPDFDTDGIVDARDNCPNAMNVLQADSGGVGNLFDTGGFSPDMIGDACQCGDVNDDGRVTLTDAMLIRDTLDPTMLPAFNKCNVIDVGDTVQECTLEDAQLIQDTVFSVPPVSLPQICTAATGMAPVMDPVPAFR